MFHFLGFLFIIIIAILLIGLSIIGTVIRSIFGLGSRRSSNTYRNDNGNYQSGRGYSFNGRQQSGSSSNEEPNLFVFRTTRQTCYSEIFQKSIICVLQQKSLSSMQRIHPPILLSLPQF